jgi:hypothetical protein
VLDLYFSELDEVKRGCLIGDALDRGMLGERDREQLEEGSQRMNASIISSYHEDNEF